MNKRQTFILTFFGLACIIFLSFTFLSVSEGFYVLSKKGFKSETLTVLPDWIRDWYEGYPPFMALFGYICSALSAFFTLKEKKKGFRLISILSFVFLFLIFVFLM